MSGKRETDFEYVTSFLGDWGCFQITVMVLLSLGTLPSGYMVMMAVFTSHTPEFRCKASANSSSSGWSCSRYQVNRNWTQGPGPTNDTEPCLDGWDFSNGTPASTIVTEVRTSLEPAERLFFFFFNLFMCILQWDLVCEDAWKVPFSTSLFFFGVFIGILVFGDLSDR